MKRGEPSVARQMQRRGNNKEAEKKAQYDGNAEQMISTGSTLLDLVISGGRVRGGGIPGGIFVEIMGQKKTGKTVLLCEIAGDVQRKNGDIMFRDPEARLNTQFAQIFGLQIDDLDYGTPDTVTEVFKSIRAWEPDGGSDTISGIFADSLAALSTDLEIEKEEGDKMGMRRAKEFSEELRKTCRLITKNNWLLVASNQMRQSGNTGYGEKYKSPGGEALGFYTSLRLKTELVQKLKDVKKVQGKEVIKYKGVCTKVKVYDSSVWKPYGEADIYIIFDYGIDDIRANLNYIKQYGPKVKVEGDKGKSKEYSGYVINDRTLAPGIEDAIRMVEREGLEHELREQVIDLWEEIEEKFKVERKPKMR